MPDIIVITGDLIDASHTDIGIALGFAQESVKIALTYFVAGNHEAASPQYDTLKSGLEAANRHMRRSARKLGVAVGDKRNETFLKAGSYY